MTGLIEFIWHPYFMVPLLVITALGWINANLDKVIEEKEDRE